MEEKKQYKYFYLAMHLFIIVFITVLSRSATLVRIVHLIPFWSRFSREHIIQLLVNVVLFVPLGYYLTMAFRSSIKVYIIASAISICVELLQFFTYRGVLDSEDIICNISGAIAGRFVWKLITQKKIKCINNVMMSLGLMSCLAVMLSTNQGETNLTITRQFDFGIDGVQTVGDKIILNGHCYLYDRRTPPYSLLINGKEIDTIIDNDLFQAEGMIISEKSEVMIQFLGFQAMTTGIFLRPSSYDKVEIDYLAENVIDPVNVYGKLKAYNLEYDSYVYQDGNTLTWLIGYEISPSTEIIYHLYTNEPQCLPKDRISSGFDNRGFRTGSIKERKRMDHYRVFVDIIPTEYNVTEVVVGFNSAGRLTWLQGFRVK